MFNFQDACAKKIQTKNEFFCHANKYEMALLVCKEFRKIIRSKYQRTTSEIPVFFILRCLKIVK